MLRSRAAFAPNAAAFFSSTCIMTVELLAGRIIAYHVGSSLYTWTSVIGVVLAGIAAGNWVGGRLADRYKPQAALAALFSVASFCCFAVPFVNRFAGESAFLLKQEWPVRIALHVSLVFFLPAVVLGCVGPMAAKMALDLGAEVGRTVGNVYAWGAVGSIAGTFLTGFVLIAKMGTIAVLVAAGAVLAAVAVVAARSLVSFAWAGIAGVLVLTTAAPWPWAVRWGTRLGLVRETSSSVLYVDESQYSFIQIEEEEDPPGTRSMALDHLVHAYVVMDDPGNLQYDYEDVYAFVTRHALVKRSRLSSLFLGGGGFVFPRYILSNWPGSYVEVAEIDPRVTEAAHAAFGLPRNSPIRIYNLDARNHVDDLLNRKRAGEPGPAFDFIYGDAFNHYAVPYHLTTLEFLQKLRALMSSDGVYLMNVLDIYDSGLFLGAILNTFQECFPHVYAFSALARGPSLEKDQRDTFVVVGARRPLPPEALNLGEIGAALKPEHREALRRRSRGIVLTDDYAPVEQLLEPVIRRARKEG